MDNGDLLKQREQSDACIEYAESRHNGTQSILNFQFSIFN